MAIKGKRRTRTRQPVRAPRRGPVPVPQPLARRRGVQMVAAFIAGLLVFWGGIWLTNGLREQRATEENRAEELRRRQAGQAWNELVTTEVGTIGTVQEGRPPEILPQVRATIDALGGEEPPSTAVEDLRAAATEAEEAAVAIDGFDLTAAIRNRGFDQAAVLRFVAARDELVLAIDLHREAALVGVLAARLEGDERALALARAESLLTEAGEAVSRFFIHHSEAMTAAGLVQQPTFPGS